MIPGCSRMRKDSAGRSNRSRCKAAREATSEAYSLYVEQGATEPTKQMGLFQRPASAGNGLPTIARMIDDPCPLEQPRGAC